MMWPFRKKSQPSVDRREWNEDWQVGDTAECIVDGARIIWHPDISPWERPVFGQKFTVSGFCEGRGNGGTLHYFLKFSDWPIPLSTTGFRKVRTVKSEESEVVKRILKAPNPGKDRVREGAA